MSSQFVVGMDLGTTNSVVAYAPLETEQPEIQLLPIPQIVGAGTVESRTSLPSFIYLSTEQEADSFQLPWSDSGRRVVGEFARRQSAEVPHRTVAGAKSWLGNSRVDRHQPILPWDAPADVEKISPADASRSYLSHLIAAWNHAMRDAPLDQQQVVLTVPASFDAAARDLTREAAFTAGFPSDFVLLEEPQAAVYAWLAQMGDRWRRALSVGNTLLVCDVGGGTTDLTLVGVAEEDGELMLKRKAVGNHLLIGGDNMDLALAHYAAELFNAQGHQLDAWQSVSLWHSCRHAKETMLAPEGPDRQTISIAGRGSKMIRGAVKAEIHRDTAADLLLEGFLPVCKLSDRPQRQRVSGFQEIGLPFESDPGITRHVATFLSAHGETSGEPIRPSHVLFNGGVFKSDVLRSRLLEVIGQWFGGDDTPVPLEGEHDLENAVARGAAYYAFTKHQGGVRIRGGTARAYYVGVETAGLAVPGAPRPLKALCVVPIGMEEGTEVDVPSSEFGLVVGEPAKFRFFSSSIRKQDRPGDLVGRWDDDEVMESDSLEATLEAVEGIDEPYVPVQFQSRITELGVFELWCVHKDSGNRWKLEFSVREQD